MRVAVAAVEQQRRSRRKRQLPEFVCALQLILRQSAIRVVLIRPREVGAIVRTVEEEAVGQNRSAEVHRSPRTVLLIGEDLRATLRGDEVSVQCLVAHFAGEFLRTGFRDGVDQETARAVEVRCLCAAADDGDLLDVVIVRIGRVDVQHSEQRHRDVHAVELIDVVLTARARARAAECVGVVHDAGDELLQIAVVLRDRQLANLLTRQTALQRRRFFVDQRCFSSDGDALRNGGHAELRVEWRFLTEEYFRFSRDGLHAGKRERHRVRSWHECRQSIFAGRVGRRDARLRQDIGARFDRYTRKDGAVGCRHFPFDGARLLRKR